jgi:hypothetical protein
MAPDPIVEEIHRVREEYAKRFGNDLREIAKDAQKRQGRDGRKVVRATPRPASGKPQRGTAA